MDQNKPHYVDINKITLRLPAYTDSDGETYVAISDVRRILTEAPAEDVQKVKHGKWEQVYDKYPRYKCTACNHLFNNKSFRFCPNCGAKMEEKNDVRI